MSQILIYHQERMDGRTITGLEFNGQKVLSYASKILIEDRWNPALQFFLYLQFELQVQDMSEQLAYQWCLKHDPLIKKIASDLLLQFPMGLDVTSVPFRWEYEPDPGVNCVLTVMTLNRKVASEFPQRIRTFRDTHWPDFLKNTDAMMVQYA